MNNSDFESRRTSSRFRKRRGTLRWIFGGLLLVIFLALFVAPLALVALGVFTFAHPIFWFFPIGLILFVLFIFAVTRLAFWGWHGGYWRGYGGYGGWGYWDDSATDILRMRYAKGEITKDQFDQMMKDLQAKDA